MYLQKRKNDFRFKVEYLFMQLSAFILHFLCTVVLPKHLSRPFKDESSTKKRSNSKCVEVVLKKSLSYSQSTPIGPLSKVVS